MFSDGLELTYDETLYNDYLIILSLRINVPQLRYYMHVTYE